MSEDILSRQREAALQNEIRIYDQATVTQAFYIKKLEALLSRCLPLLKLVATTYVDQNRDVAGDLLADINTFLGIEPADEGN